MVMCTKDKTYNGKEVERSNTMLLTNMKSIPENINGVKIREFNVRYDFMLKIKQL
jgi:hypothetical protein